MAAYMQVGRFGDDLSGGYDDGGYDATSQDYPSDYPSSPGYTSSTEGTGTSVDWTNVIATGLNVGASLIHPGAGQINPGAMPTSLAAIRPGTVAAAGSIGSNALLIGGLALAAIFLMRK